MTRESHIGLQRRKELCGRLFYFDTIQPYKENFSRCGAGPALDVLRNSLFNFISDELSDTTNDLSGDTFLRKLTSRFLRTAEPELERHPQLFEVVKTALQKRGDEISCANCNSLRSGVGNEEVISSRGCCMSPLRQMFDIAHKTARIYYSKFATHSETILPEVVFSTRHSRDMSDLHDLPVPYAVTGGTQYCSLGEQSWTEVYLKMCVEKFDYDSYMATPYILFHECIAHAFHGVIPSPLNRKPSEPEDEFAEGWMDFVAFKIMEEVMDKKGPAKHLSSKVNFTDEHYHRSFNLYFSRVDLNVSHPYKPSEHAIHRKLGQSAANKVLHVLGRLPESYKNPWQAFLQMSLDLNMHQGFEQTQRHKFVALINNLAKPGEIDTPRHCEIVPIIRKYLKNQDAIGFIEDILGLKERWLNKNQIIFTPSEPNVIHLTQNNPKWRISH